MNAVQAIARETTALDLRDAAEALPASFPPSSVELSPRQMVYQLIARGSNLNDVKEFIAMNRELADEEAMKAFIAARAKAKAEIPVIVKNKHVGFDSKRGGASTDYWHEDLSEIIKTIDPILSKYGLSYEFVPLQAGPTLTITCILSHEQGHSRSYPMSGPNDTSGNKNSLQAAGSTATYLSRYTLKMALGLAASKDDDGATSEQTVAESTTLSERQVMDLADLLEETAAGRKDHKKAFLAYMKVESLSEIPAKDYQRAVDAVNSTRVRT